MQRVLQSDIAKEQEYQALNIAKGLGRIHIIPKLDDHVEIGFNEILVLDEVPVQLPPVAGIITSQPSTPLSHINLLAKGWGIPNAYIKNAKELLKQYDGWWVSFETLRENYTIKRADMNQLREYQRRQAERLDVMKPRYNLSETRLLSLDSNSVAIEPRVRRQVGKSRRGAERAPARNHCAQRFHDSFLLLRRIHKAQQTRRSDLRTIERSEVCSRSCLPPRATGPTATEDRKR